MSAENKQDDLPIVVACSGASLHGQLADLVARSLQEKGLARMVSLSGLSANINESSRAAMAKKVIVIDGCHSGCASQAMALKQYDDCEYVDLIGAGISKPGVAPTKTDVERGVKHIRKIL